MISIANCFIITTGLLLFCSGVHAATTCTLINPSISLGNYDTFTPSSTDASSTIIVNCSRAGGSQSVTVTLAIGPSLHTGAVASRKLKHTVNTDLLGYNLYRDASRTIVWGNSGGVNTVSQTISIPNNASRTATFVVNTRIDALQNVRAGDYADSLQVSVLP